MADATPPARSTTGVPGLDDVLHGGLLAGQLYLLDGNPGSGKTTLALQFLLEGLRQGESCLYITLSETAEELRAGAASHGWSLDGVEIFELTPEEHGLDGSGDLTMYHPSEVELGETTRKVLDVVDRLKPHRMVFDSLSEMRLLAQSSLRYRRQILALKQFFIGRQCTVLLLDDRTAEGADLQLQSIAHGVISLGRMAPTYGPAQRRLQVVKFRGSDFLSGFQDLRIVRGGGEVFPRLRAGAHCGAYIGEVVPSGVASLDRLFGGGISRGTATLVIGPAGAGKTTLAMQFAAAAAARGDHAAVFTFEESRELLLARSAALGLSIPEGGGPGAVAVRRVDPAELSPGEFAQLIHSAVEADGARVVVIDSLNGYMNAMPEERALTVQLHELLNYLNSHGVATFLIAAQAGALGPAHRTPVDASYLADSVVMLRMFEHQGQVKKAIAMLKKRSGAHEASVRELRLDSQGVHLSEPLLQLRGVMSGWLVDPPSPAAVGPN
jgi:circadian clock protein KaiC